MKRIAILIAALSAFAFSATAFAAPTMHCQHKDDVGCISAQTGKVAPLSAVELTP